MEQKEKELIPNNKIILVVEDDKDIQDSLKLALEIEGYKVFIADNGKEAMEKLAKIPTPCLILLDLMMPVMNGWEFIEVISKDLMLSTIPIVVVSAFGDKKSLTKFDGYIPKPIDLSILLGAVCKHCG